MKRKEKRARDDTGKGTWTLEKEQVYNIGAQGYKGIREGKEAKSRPRRRINPKEQEERYKQGDKDTTAWEQKTEMRGEKKVEK